MKLTIFSDIHWQYPSFSKPDFPPADVCVFAGDWSGIGTEKEARAFAEWYSDLPFRHKLAIPGNHERFIAAWPEAGKKIFSDAGIQLLIDEPAEINGVKFWGTPWCPGFGDWSWAFLGSERSLSNHYSRIPDDTQVLITHCPPAGILDGGYGSEALRDRVRGLRALKLHSFGHIHGAHGEMEEDGVKFMNVSVLGDDYEKLSVAGTVILEEIL